MKKLGGYIRPWTASEYLGIPLDEVEKMLESGELPGVKFGGQWRVPLGELENWLDEDVSEKEIRELADHIDVKDEQVDEFMSDRADSDEDTSN